MQVLLSSMGASRKQCWLNKGLITFPGMKQNRGLVCTRKEGELRALVKNVFFRTSYDHVSMGLENWYQRSRSPPPFPSLLLPPMVRKAEDKYGRNRPSAPCSPIVQNDHSKKLDNWHHCSSLQLFPIFPAMCGRRNNLPQTDQLAYFLLKGQNLLLLKWSKGMGGKGCKAETSRE